MYSRSIFQTARRKTMAKKKFDLTKLPFESNSRFKKTSIGKKANLSMMNKSKRRAHKK